jgi:hypothetical protein
MALLNSTTIKDCLPLLHGAISIPIPLSCTTNRTTHVYIGTSEPSVSLAAVVWDGEAVQATTVSSSSGFFLCHQSLFFSPFHVLAILFIHCQD